MDRFRERRDGIRQIIGRSPLLRRGTVKLAADAVLPDEGRRSGGRTKSPDSSR